MNCFRAPYSRSFVLPTNSTCARSPSSVNSYLKSRLRSRATQSDDTGFPLCITNGAPESFLVCVSISPFISACHRGECPFTTSSSAAKANRRSPAGISSSNIGWEFPSPSPYPRVPARVSQQSLPGCPNPHLPTVCASLSQRPSSQVAFARRPPHPFGSSLFVYIAREADPT